MNMFRRIGAVAGSAALVAGSLVLTASTASAADWDCPSGSNPGTFPGTATTPVPAVSVGGRKYELRYNSTTRCAWGRVTQGQVGDTVWVDWSRTAGGDHAPWVQLGVTRISSGRDVFTPAYNDQGYYMRACGQPTGGGYPIVCTGWY